MNQHMPGSVRDGKAGKRVRLAALAACTVAAGTGVLATPAHAAGPVLKVVADREVSLPATDDPTDPVHLGWLLEKDGAGTAKDVKLVFDLSGVKGFAKAPDLNCPHVDAVYTCDKGDIDDTANAGGIVRLAPTGGAALGDTGTVRISGTSSNGEVVGAATTVTVGSPDLAVGRLPDRNVKLRTTHRNEITISNNGTLPAEGVVLRLRATPGLGYADRFSNCVYSTVDEPGYNARAQALCRFGTVIGPGKSYTLERPVGLRIEKSALFEIFDYEAQVADSPAAAVLTGGERWSSGGEGTAGALALKPSGTVRTRAAEPDPGDNHRRQSLDADSSADLVGEGDSAGGRPGDEVTLNARLRNAGPGWVGIHGSDDQPGLLVTIPKGTRAVKVPKDCGVWNIDGPAGPGVPGKPQYICQALPRFLGEGTTYPFAFTVRIGENAKTTSGSARATTVYGSTLAFDKNHRNDTGRLTVRVEGTGPGSSGGSDPGGSGASGGPSGASGVSGGDEPGPQSAGGTSGGTAAGSGGGLASTGTDGVTLITGAAATAAVGAAMFLAVRRRRTGPSAK